MDLTSLIGKYSRPGPRYTSYPTAPQWSDSIGADTYRERLSRVPADVPLALYVHIPFCESLCYYCGCNIKITHDRGVSSPYSGVCVEEAAQVARALGRRQPVNQISWGGGTPTFLSPEEMATLFEGLTGHFELQPDAEVSIEVDPRATTAEHLSVLKRVGFNRISLGVQDFDPEVQRAVNRVQTVDMTAGMVRDCRSLGFKGINLDLIYGLPLQTEERFARTVDTVLQIRPDRIALYNYAHLPSMIPHQKILEKYEMPDAGTRVRLFEAAYQSLVGAGYVAIGMDHFALQTDELARAASEGTLYRNFMGYTVKRTPGLIGIGASAIGEVEGAYFQNVREVPRYESAIREGGLATFRGCLLSAEDLRRKWIIQSLMCRFEIAYSTYQDRFGEDFRQRFAAEKDALGAFFDDSLLEDADSGIRVTSLGRLFVRNAAMVFDQYLGPAQKVTFSKTV